jgi:hypothetical protein
MPCGGIYPIEYTRWKDCYIPGAQEKCFVCRDPWDPNAAYVYFCDEWDCWIHKGCIHEFLLTEEAKVVIRHKHEIQIDEDF